MKFLWLEWLSILLQIFVNWALPKAETCAANTLLDSYKSVYKNSIRNW